MGGASAHSPSTPLPPLRYDDSPLRNPSQPEFGTSYQDRIDVLGMNICTSNASPDTIKSTLVSLVLSNVP